MTKKDQEIIRLRESGMEYSAVAQALNQQGISITENYATKRYNTLKRRGLTTNAVVSTPVIKEQSPAGAVTEDELRKRHDMFFIIHSRVMQIPVSMYIEETQLLKELGLYGKPRFRDALSRPELKEHRGKVDGTVYYGAIESISKLKKEGVLQ